MLTDMLFELQSTLLLQEEFLVRDAAMHTLNACVARLPKHDVTSKFMPMLKR